MTDAERAQIAAVYTTARLMTMNTGIQYHVDHIIPLARGGLHHPSNLQVITADQNRRKFTKLKDELMPKNEDLIEDLLRPDQSDRATAMEELRRRAALEARKPAGPVVTGYCHNCEARLAPGLRWCDHFCRDDWEKTRRTAE